MALGSNLGDRPRTSARRARRSPRYRRPGLVAASAIEETPPLGGMEQPPYLNQMVLLETGLEPRALLQACQAIERREGRERTEHWGPRTLDLDIVRFGDRRVNGTRPYHSSSRAAQSRLLAAESWRN